MKEEHHVNERKNSMRWMVDEASLNTFHLKYTAINSGILSLIWSTGNQEALG